jgi:hypothetical protein
MCRARRRLIHDLSGSAKNSPRRPRPRKEEEVISVRTTFTAAAKWDGRTWWPAVDIFEEWPDYRVKKRTVKGNNSFESQDEALKEAYGLADNAQEKSGPFSTKTKH